MELNSLGLNKSPADTKVCVAMSGGVDSSVTAYLLKRQGYDVFGLTMDLLEAPYAPEISSIADAAKTATQIGIPHFMLDLKKEFRREVVDYFSEAYLRGQTPSPCIICNQQIKLGRLCDEARLRGADCLVTGHYADIRLTEHGAELHRAEDRVRDQSYFLFAVSRENLQMLRCPLAKFSKAETRQIAVEAGLKIAHKADSQDICFVCNGKYGNLIRKLRPDYDDESGEIVDLSGQVLGRHKGIINYTVGQRKGLGIGGRKGQKDGESLYVLKIDGEHNRIIAGAEEDLYRQKVFIRDVNWLGEARPARMELMVKLRSRQAAVPAAVTFNGCEAEVLLQEAFAAAAPGQGCCFYQGTRVMGGGFII